jgi:hypothetical protein
MQEECNMADKQAKTYRLTILHVDHVNSIHIHFDNVGETFLISLTNDLRSSPDVQSVGVYVQDAFGNWKEQY